MEDFETVKTAVFELSKKEQDELMLAILESRSGKKSKKSSAEPKEKREMSTGQKAWTDFIKHVAETVQGTLGDDKKKFSYKNAMSVASALKKDGKMEADDATILTFYRTWVETATPPTTDSEAVVEKPKAVKAEPKAKKAAEEPAPAPAAAAASTEKPKKASKKDKVV